MNSSKNGKTEIARNQWNHRCKLLLTIIVVTIVICYKQITKNFKKNKNKNKKVDKTEIARNQWNHRYKLLLTIIFVIIINC